MCSAGEGGSGGGGRRTGRTSGQRLRGDAGAVAAHNAGGSDGSGGDCSIGLRNKGGKEPGGRGEGRKDGVAGMVDLKTWEVSGCLE